MPGRTYERLGRVSMWHWLFIGLVVSEALTFLISYAVSHLLWGRMPNEVLVIGLIDSLAVAFVIVGVLLLSIRTIRRLNGKLEEQNRVLTAAISEIKTLQGILPICSYCKQIRNDEGYYEQIEEYISDHSDVDFSHTICPACAKEHFPELGLGADTPSG